MTKKEVKYQAGVLPNLLSGFYEQVEMEKQNLSLQVIFCELRKEFEKILNQKERTVGFVVEKNGKYLIDNKINLWGSLFEKVVFFKSITSANKAIVFVKNELCIDVKDVRVLKVVVKEYD